ncbi:MAG: ankyrin repeat domain-containing protein [Dokdonella sp.]|nr:ankyrin repeat domain-containing protein [Dokdonella sp.]
MANLDEVLKRVGDVADYSGIPATDANTKGLFNQRPLHVVAVWGDCEAIEILVRAGARINEQGEHGFTPLMEATAHGHVAACKLLVELGASPIRNDDGQLPSEYAQIGGNQELGSWLSAHGF